MFEKIWDAHLVHADPGQQAILYIDLHLVHEVTSPQAFEGLRLAGRKVRRPELTIATADHNVPTTDRGLPIADPISKQQIDTLRENCREFGIRLYDLNDAKQGIVHIIGPELGLTQPGTTIVCGDSHTATHGALGALAFGIGTSEVEHVLATQTLLQSHPKTFELRVDGRLPQGVTAKDIILYLIGQITTDGGTGYVIEYTGSTIRGLSMAERLTVCNMSIEAGARAGMIAPDQTTYDYLCGREFAPKDFNAAVARWKKLPSDPGASYDRVEVFQAADVTPQVTWGTNPGQVAAVNSAVPDPAKLSTEDERKTAARRSNTWTSSRASRSRRSTSIECSSAPARTAGSRICGRQRRSSAGIASPAPLTRWLSLAAARSKGRRKRKGLDKVFRAAGFDWREAGCSMCLGMNPDILKPGQRCASTSNRNFEGRQGKGGRTHLVSPAMAAAAAVTGHFVDIRDWKFKE